MKKGKATPERNGKPSITAHVKTRTPAEAFNMLRQGHVVDVMAGYYDDKELIKDDFWMMDKVGKLHALAELRENEKHLQAQFNEQEKEFNRIKQIQDEQQKQESQPINEGQGIQSKPNAGGEVSQSRANA